MKSGYILPVLGLGLLEAIPAQAVCPVCVVAVGAGLGLSQYLGIDDTIAGVWIGGLLVALSAWTINWFDKKKWLAKYRTIRDFSTYILYYVLVIWPLYGQGLIGPDNNRLFGFDKLLFGIIVGSLFFASSVRLYETMKRNNKGKAHFPFEKVVLPLAALALASLIFFFLTK